MASRHQVTENSPASKVCNQAPALLDPWRRKLTGRALCHNSRSDKNQGRNYCRLTCNLPASNPPAPRQVQNKVFLLPEGRHLPPPDKPCRPCAARPPRNPKKKQVSFSFPYLCQNPCRSKLKSRSYFLCKSFPSGHFRIKISVP